ncbi:MAG: hypothetical protein ACR2PM_19170 [Hyphomicrobiales bacterium]
MSESDHWLTRPETIKRIWIGSCAVLALLVLSDVVVHHHAHFGVDGTFGFYSWYGFAACVVLVVGSKALGAVLKRRDTYYDS